MDIQETIKGFERCTNTEGVFKKIRKLELSNNEAAQVLWALSEEGRFNLNVSSSFYAIKRAEAPYSTAQLAMLLRGGPLSERLSAPDWWEAYNLHDLVPCISEVIEGAEGDPAPLLEVAPALEGLTGCVLEITLVMMGALTLDEIRAHHREAFFNLALTMSFSDNLDGMLQRLLGGGWLRALAERIPEMPWRLVSEVKRFEAIFDALSPRAAAALIARGYWDDLGLAQRLIEAHPGDLTEGFLEQAERWLEGIAADNRFGGRGDLLTLIALKRRGVMTERHHPLLYTLGYMGDALPLIKEAIGGLPLEERARRAFDSGFIAWIYVEQCPTPEVTRRAVEGALAWTKQDMKGSMVHDARPALFAIAEEAREALIEALEGPIVPASPLLLDAFGFTREASNAPLLAGLLSEKKLHAKAAYWLAELGAEVALPIAAEALTSRKKDARLGGALILDELEEKTEAVKEVAAARLPKEKAKAVVEALTRVIEA